MNNVLYLFLRRMRFPLVLIIALYAVTVTGLALMPGVDAEGNPTPGMGVFNAFYVISYTSTTIGFGELPAPYSAAQRIWMTVSMYLTVIGWSFSVVQVVALLQEQAFQNAVKASRFARRILHLQEPFYIVCGYGETGSMVTRGLDRLGLRVVVVDPNREKLQRAVLAGFGSDVPTLAGDAADPTILTTSGLLSPHCRGVMALADDQTNRSIAVTVRLLAPSVPVMARVGDPEEELNLGAFGGDFIVNPFERFAEALVEAVAAPESFHLREILTGLAGDDLPERHDPPKGDWIMCGYGRFGHRVREELEGAGLGVTVIDRLHYGEPGVDIEGTGMDAASLRAAGVENACGIVAGNRNDLKNLAIALTARELNPGIFIVTRENLISSRALFEAFEDDLSMQPSRIVARQFLVTITTPMLSRFTTLMSQRGEVWARQLSDQLRDVNAGLVPEVWNLVMGDRSAGIACGVIRSGQHVTVGHLLTDPYRRDAKENALVLMVERDGESIVLPSRDFELQLDDHLLLAGSRKAQSRIALAVRNPRVLQYIRTGREGYGGLVWRKGAELRRAWVRDQAHRHRTKAD
ncbi:MAG: potassium channel family protein [Arachnia sp.]